MGDGPLRHSEYLPRCGDCEAVAQLGCLRCGRPLCARCEPPADRRCGRCEREWRELSARLDNEARPAGPLLLFCSRILAPSLGAAALAFVVLVFGGGGIFGPLAMALALVAAINLPILALGPGELASEMGEARARARTRAARRRFLAARPPGG